MHFVGMLASPLPPGTVYLVLPTIISFLICALVVGVSLFFVSIGEPTCRAWSPRLCCSGSASSACIMSACTDCPGHFAMTHDGAMVVLSVLIAIVAAYGGLRAFLARQAACG